MSYRTKLRGAVVSTCTVALLAGSGLLTAPAQAIGNQAVPAHTATTRHRSSPAEDQVVTFFRHYREAAKGTRAQTLLQVEEEFLTPELIKQLAAYASANQVDPVFRQENIPVTYSYADGGAWDLLSHKVILTMNFEDGSSTVMWYKVQDVDRAITNLENAPS